MIGTGTVRARPIGPQIEAFLRSTFAAASPRWVVTVERKGTALLRAGTSLKDPAGHQLFHWDQLISSDVLRRVSDSSLSNGVVLVVDEGTHHGRRIRDALKVLTEHKNVPRDRIKVAVFGVQKGGSLRHVDYSWFDQLSEDSYGRVRGQVIEFFQEKGSLLLDTEHIEVPVELNCGRLEFFDALCAAGTGVEYVSDIGRTHLTVYNPTLLDEEDFLAQLPEGTSIRGVVRKIRIVERGRDRYAIIPIFYPSVPEGVGSGSVRSLEPCLREQVEDTDTVFKVVGVFAAIMLFKTVFACLRRLVNDGRIRVQIPQPNDPEDAVSHLVTLFPNLNVHQLHGFVERCVEDGRKYKARKAQLCKPFRIDATQGTRHGCDIDRIHWAVLKEVRRIWRASPCGPRGATLHELMQLVKEWRGHPGHLPEALLSTALDRAIDRAELVTARSVLPFSDGRRRWVRTFRLDGESVLADVERVASLWRSEGWPPS